MSGPLSFLATILQTVASFIVIVALFSLGSATLRRFSGRGAESLADAPQAMATGAALAPKEYNKVHRLAAPPLDGMGFQKQH